MKFSESANIDCIDNEMGNAEDLCRLADSLQNTEPQKGLHLSVKALEISESNDNRHGIIASLVSMSCCLVNLSQYDEALHVLQRCVSMPEAQLDRKKYVQALINIGRVYLTRGIYSESQEYYEQALLLAKENFLSEAEIQSKIGLGGTCLGRGDHKNTISFLSEALDQSRERNYEPGVIAALNGMANLYMNTGMLENAMEYFLEALALAEKKGDLRSQANIYINIGIVYRRLGDDTNSLKYSLLCLEKQKIIGEKKSIAICLNNIGSSYYKFHDFPQALEYYFQSLELRRELGDRPGEATTLANIGEVYIQLNLPDEAFKAFQQSLHIRHTINNLSGEATVLLSLGKLFLQYNDPARAVEYLQSALAISESLTLQEQNAALHKLLSGAFRVLGDYQKALEHHEKYFGIQETIYNDRIDSRTQSLMIKFDTEKALRDAEIERLRNVELSNANQRLEQLNIEKGEFLAVAAHDLKNPLYNIKMLSEILMQPDSLSADDIREFASDIASVSNTMFEIVKSLLDIEAIESGKLKLNIEEFSGSTVVKTVAKRYSVNAAAKKISIDTSKINSSITISTDTVRFMEIIDNLVSNAIKYSPHGKEIILRLFTNDNKRLRFEVQDQGHGISPDDMEKLFGKFQRLSARPTGNESSTGLGLSIVKKLTEAMQGTIWCESEVGAGTTFFLELPLQMEKV